MPPVSNTITSSYADITSAPGKAPEIARTTSPRMDAPTDNSGREDPSIIPDNSNNEVAQPEQMEEPPHQGDQTSGASTRYPQVVPPHETPQQPSYYGAYSNSQVTPESPSPNRNNGRTSYNGGSFFQPQPAAGFQNSPFTNDGTHQYPGGPSSQPPSSPTQSMGGIPPASPLFPRMTGPMQAYLNTSRGGDTVVNQGMSSVPSPYASSSGMYIPGTYPMLAGRPNGSSNNNSTNTMNSNNVNEEYLGWNDNRNPPYSLSPGQGGMPYVPGMPLRPDRSASFDDAVLPHSLADGSQNAYGAGPGSGPQAWGYGAPPLDAYGNNSNLSQGRPSGPYPGQPGGPQFRQQSQFGGPYGGHFGFPSTSPGPPIQTTSSNKGPDGANLFIFHIPNHFTNLDMYQLFCPYGNLLSVRIMVEKDSGRSRGFGFVSYDNPDAAALAIKELNGFAIGNKRLKVQHKQIRPAEQQNQDMNYVVHGGGGHPQHHGGRGRGGRGGFSGRGGNNLPPSGSMTMPPTEWYSNNDLNNNPSGSPSATTGDVVSSDSPHVVVVLGDGPSNSTNVAIAESAGASAVVSGQDEQNAKVDPLSSMDPLRQSLPDMGGVATPAAPGEN